MASPCEPLQGKVALVTGAGRGIGRIIAEVFSAAGASVVITDVQEVQGQAVAQSISDAGRNALFFAANLRQEDDIKGMVDFAVSNFQRLDIVINNARPRLQHLPLGESLSEWDLAMDVLLKAPALTAKHALPQMARSGGGSIVNVASTTASFISHQPLAYHVAKAGLLQLTRYIAYEFGSQRIRVNAICPALVDLYDDNKPLTSDPVNKAVADLVIPLGRASSGAEIAEVALFLCTDASAYITGQVLTIDGGLTLGEHFHIARKAFRYASSGIE